MFFFFEVNEKLFRYQNKFATEQPNYPSSNRNFLFLKFPLIITELTLIQSLTKPLKPTADITITCSRGSCFYEILSLTGPYRSQILLLLYKLNAYVAVLWADVLPNYQFIGQASRKAEA